MKKKLIAYLSDKEFSTKKKVQDRIIHSSKKEQKLVEYYKLNYQILLATEDLDDKRIYSDIIKEIESKEKPTPWYFSTWLNIAASLIFLIGLGSMYFNQSTPSIPLNVAPKLDDIVLIFEDGSQEILSNPTNETSLFKNGKKIGSLSNEQLALQKEDSKEYPTSQTLKIPYGKQFKLILSDGSQVYLNAGTTLTYPTTFNTSGNRELFLDGEAYFEVTHDSKRPFVVHTSTMDVAVLGTEFNVSSYHLETNKEVVLVSGKVAVSLPDNHLKKSNILNPGDKASHSNSQQALEITKVDTRLYTAWKENELIFKNTAFGTIIKRLERHYNVTIINHKEHLNNEYFSARFKNASIEEVLSYLAESYQLKYTVDGHQITIN